MKIKGTHVETCTIEVEIPAKQIIRNLREKFLEQLKLPKESWLKDETSEWWVTETYHTSHSWDERKRVRPATEEEVAVWNALRTLDKSFKE